MTYKFLFIPRETYDHTPSIVGFRYIHDHKNEAIEVSAVSEYLTAGYTKGVDYVIYNDRAWLIYKTYVDVEEKYVYFVCIESVDGCDTL